MQCTTVFLMIILNQCSVFSGLVKVLFEYIWIIIHVHVCTSLTRIFHKHGEITNAGIYWHNARRLQIVMSVGSLYISCHTYCLRGPQFLWCHSKDRPISSPLTTSKGFWERFLNQASTGLLYFRTVVLFFSHSSVVIFINNIALNRDTDAEQR